MFTRVIRQLGRYFNHCIKIDLRSGYSYASKYPIVNMQQSQLLNPPDTVQGMTELQKELFNKDISVPTLTKHTRGLSDILKVLKKYLLKINGFKAIQNTDTETVIYLNPYLVDCNNLPEDLENALKPLNISKENFSVKDLALTYRNFTADQIFKAVLPSDKDGMSSYTKVGHIVHVNLREHLIPFKNLIGQVLFDKTPACRTVVNKTNMIDNTYRNFQMEILQGEDDMMVTLKENLCTFQFDFSTVYWNSRLSTEHERIVKQLNTNDVLFDVFAGVGPFSVPIAKKKCIVYANDLNPESYKWLNHNFKINKINNEYFKMFNKDGRDFILHEIKELLPKYLGFHDVYITMNLPAMAIEFLDAFVGLLEEKDIPETFKAPTIFVYCFAKGEDYMSITRNLILEHLGPVKIENMFKVRTVSSLKEMMRVTIKLEKEILLGHVGKKRKIDEEYLPLKKCNHGKEQEI